MIALKKAMSWVAVAGGFLLGVIGISIFAASPVLVEYELNSQLRFYIIAAGMLGVTSITGSVFALRKRKIAGWIFLFGCASIAICRVLARPYWLSGPGPILVGTCLFLLSVFWFWTERLRWPEFVVVRLTTLKGKFLVWGFFGLFLFASVSVGAIKVTMSQENIGDCGGGPPVSKPYPGRSAFVASVVHFDSWLGAVSVVQERFWGLPKSTRVVFLQLYAKPGDVFFVDGRQSPGLLTRYIFPVVVLFCGRSAPVQYAGVDLRVLREGPPKSGVRIIGKTGPDWGEGVPGVNVIIDGPNGETITTSDKDGIYDVSGLPPGQYTVRAYVRDQRYATRSTCRPKNLDLKTGDVGGCSIPVFEKPLN